jgi:hypothetical protein
LLSIHSREIASLYIGEAVFSDLSGQNTVAISDRLIGAVRALRGSYGSINPESIVQHDGRVYGFDVNKGVTWRYSQDGLTDIGSIFCKNYFYDKSQSLILNKDTEKIYGGFDPYFNEYILSFNDETIAFSEPLNRWTTYYSYLPESIQKTGTKMVSFKNGAIYLHGSSATHNNFYGSQYTSKIKIATNENPSVPKLFYNIAVEGSLWTATDLDTEDSPSQHSEILSTDYENRENVWYALILRDENTVWLTGYRADNPMRHGDIMRSQYLLTMMENVDTTKATLVSAHVGFEFSKGHKF